VALVLGGCTSAAAPAGPTPGQWRALDTLRGSWQWMFASRDGAVLVIEKERWVFDDTEGDAVLGRYRRDVAFLSMDGTPFVCNQAPGYTQTSHFDVRVTAADGRLAVVETAYATVPSPCDSSFRHLGRYTAWPARRRLALLFPDGEQTLERIDAPPADLSLPAPAASIAGPWRWTLASRDDSGAARHEDERWQLAVADDGTVAATYVRTVTVATDDGTPIPCARAPRWSFTDRYTLRGRLAGDQLLLEETAVAPGVHPCLAATPTRHLDTATGTALGDHLLLTWRGNRRQVLRRR
jgi:hypothetical protein